MVELFRRHKISNVSAYTKFEAHCLDALRVRKEAVLEERVESMVSDQDKLSQLVLGDSILERNIAHALIICHCP